MDSRKNRRRILPIWQELRGEKPFKKELASVEAINLEPVMEEKPRAHIDVAGLSFGRKHC
jgi:hypothetical protein